MNGATVGTLLTDLLQSCVDAFDEVPNAPAAPVRRLVSFGEPPWYPGDTLGVWCSGLRIVSPFPLTQLRAVQSADVPAADLTILILRDCWPQPNVTTSASSSYPEPADIQAAALTAMADGSTLEAHLSMLAAKGGLFPSVPLLNGDVALSPMVPVGPQGGHVGWRWPIAVKLAIL